MTIEEKYNIIYIKNQHYYIHDLSVKDYLLEKTTPYYFKIGYDEFVETSWVKLLQTVINYLLGEYEPTKQELLDFRLPWTNKIIFFEEKSQVNLVPLDNGLFVNVNHTALHSCWFLNELMNYFKVDMSTVQLIIKRTPAAEYKEVREYYINLHKSQFKKYVLNDLGKDEEYYNKIVDGLDKTDKYFKQFSSTFISVYLFDSAAYFSNYKMEYINYLLHKTDLPEKLIQSIEKRLNIYHQFIRKYYK